jgi:hypothetical protein
MAAPAAAAPITFFGEQLGLGEGTVLAATPNADAAPASFLAGMIDPGIEEFEGFADGTAADPAATFISVAFGNSAAGVGFFGFDDFTVGTPSRSGTPFLNRGHCCWLASALAALAIRRRYRRA